MPEPQTATVEPSAFGSAIAGSLAKELPGAIAESKKLDTERSQIARDTSVRLDKDQERRETLRPPTPPVPQHAPEMQNTSAGEVWGSLAMAMAMIGSAFTRQPLVNALNAGAAVMKAAHQNDADTYKREYQRWKDQSEYGIKTYEYQRDIYKDALDMIASDEKGAIAKLRVLSQSMKDDPLHQLAKAGDVAGIITLDQQRQDGHQKYVTEHERAAIEGRVVGDVMDAGKGLREAQAALQKAPADPELQAHVAAAQERYTAAQQAAKDLHTAKTGTPGGATALHASAEFEIRDKDGKVVERIMAREGPQAGPPLRTDTGQPVTLAPGQTIHKAPPASEGRQASSQANRLIGATSELTASLKNLVELPIDSTMGPFMGLQAERPDALRDAVGRVAATHLVGEQAIAVSQQFAGLQRQLATIESQGAAQGLVGLTNANSVLVPQSGWSGTAVLRSYAEIRQIAEANIRAMLASSAVKDEQKQLLRDLQKELEQVVPYSVHDVNELAFGNKKKFKQSVGAFADKVLKRRPPEPPPSSAPSPGTQAASPSGPAAAPTPTAHKYAAEGAGGVKLYSDDGKAWFKPDGSPYTGQ